MRFAAPIALAAAFLIAAPNLAQADEKTYDLKGFHAVNISSGLNADVTIGPEFLVKAQSLRAEELAEVKIEVINGVLTAWVDGNIFNLFQFGDRRTFIHITMPAIDSAEGSGGADVDVTGPTADTLRIAASSGADLNLDDVSSKVIKIELSSGADIDVAGTCGDASIEASSGSDLHARNLTCANVDAHASSGSDITLFASQSIITEVSSGADITIHGNPPKRDKVETNSNVKFVD